MLKMRAIKWFYFKYLSIHNLGKGKVNSYLITNKNFINKTLFTLFRVGFIMLQALPRLRYTN